MSVIIIDCGIGNLKSVEKACLSIGLPAYVTRNPKDVKAAAGVILPGVGAFDPAVKFLRDSGFADELLCYLTLGHPFLGICLGMQVLFEASAEGKLRGLEVFGGRSERFDFKGTSFDNLKIPHMGWNRLLIKQPSPLFEDIQPDAMFYFVHSYIVKPQDESIVLAETDYGQNFVSAIGRENIFAVQFHPEKSGEAGLQVLKNFAKVVKTLGGK